MLDPIDQLYQLFEAWQDALANLARLEASTFVLFTDRWFAADTKVREARKAVRDFLWTFRGINDAKD